MNFSYTNRFNETIDAQILLLIVPLVGYGALESVMIESLKEKDSAQIIPECVNFVGTPKIDTFLHNERNKLKARLSTIIAIMYPDRAVDSLVEIVEGVDWCKYKQISKTFEKLLKI